MVDVNESLAVHQTLLVFVDWQRRRHPDWTVQIVLEAVRSTWWLTARNLSRSIRFVHL